MLKWLRNHRWMAIAASGAILPCTLFLGSLFVHVYGEICNKNEYTGAKECVQHHIGPFTLLWIVSVADSHNGLVTAIATILVAGFTWTLWLTSENQGRLTERAIEDAAIAGQRQYRAYVSAIAKQIVLKEDDKTIVVVIDVENMGQTPAFETQGLAAITVRPSPPHEFGIGGMASEDAGKPVPTFTLYPSGKHVSAPRYTMTPVDWGNMESGKFALYVFGRFKFLDAFGEEQWTEFCAYLDGDYFKDAIARAKESPERRQVPAGFKFTAFGNRASFR